MAMLQVRNLSVKTHNELKRRAAVARMSLSDYVAEQLDILVKVPSQEEYWGLLDEPWGDETDEVERPRSEEEKELDRFIVDYIRERRGPLG